MFVAHLATLEKALEKQEDQYENGQNDEGNQGHLSQFHAQFQVRSVAHVIGIIVVSRGLRISLG